MNTYVTPRVFGGKEAAVWLCVDRIEGKTVVLLDDQEKTVCLDTAAYEALVGRAPAESDVLAAEVADGRVNRISSRYLMHLHMNAERKMHGLNPHTKRWPL